MKRIYSVLLLSVILVLLNSSVFILLSIKNTDNSFKESSLKIFDVMYHDLYNIERHVRGYDYDLAVPMDSLDYSLFVSRLDWYIREIDGLNSIYAYRIDSLGDIRYFYHTRLNGVNYGRDSRDSLSTLYLLDYSHFYKFGRDTILFKKCVGDCDMTFLLNKKDYVLGIDFCMESIYERVSFFVVMMFIINFILFGIISLTLYKGFRDYLDFIRHFKLYVRDGFKLSSYKRDGLMSSLYDSLYVLDKRYNESLSKERELNKILENFMYITAHDLKTPLRTISIFTSKILHKLKIGDYNLKDYFKFVMTHVGRVNNLIDDILVYNSLQKFSDLKVRINVGDEIKKVMGKYDGIDYLDIRLNLDYSIYYTLNLDLFRICLDNLLNNSLKYNDKGKILVMITLLRAKDGYGLVVWDNGNGVAEEYLGKVFNIFSKLDPMGSGLGLSIVKGFFEDLGGRVSIDSKLGDWTSVNMFLPNENI